MSYILEALKKSDQQRQRGTTPTLQATQVAASERPLHLYYILFASMLLGTGIAIGWLHPWQVEQTPAETEAVATGLHVATLQQAAPAVLSASAKMPGNAAPEFPQTNPAPARQSEPVANAAKKSKAVISSAPNSAKPVNAAQEQQAISFNDLPAQIRQEIPAMEVQLHAYSSIPGERLVSINSIRLREGGSLMLGLRLEQITPDGMIFSYKGYLFQRGIR
jgi:general secretion pathway protein B